MNNILVFGEILYDIYDDVAVIGGAPFNYSVQLSRLISKNDNLKFITALGKDDFSKDAFKFIENENIDSSLMQVLDNYETGKATVFMNENKIPDYIIHENVAWDNIEFNSDIEKSGLSVFIYASNEPKSVLARDLGDCRDNLRNSRSVFLIVV